MIEGKTVVVTGGGKGIGRHAALTFAKAKAKVAIVDVNEESLNKTTEELNMFSEVTSVNADIRDEKAVHKMFSECSVANIVIITIGGIKI